MCGRFAFTSPEEAVANFFEADGSRISKTPPNTNVWPTQEIVTVVDFEGQRFLSKMRWGFIPHWYKAVNDTPLLINARSETVAEKPAYRDAFLKRRCVIPVDWYYEWSSKNPENRKIKYQIEQENGEMLGCAAIWQTWRDQSGNRTLSCAMITREANEVISPIHDRMPVMLSPEDIASWLRLEERESVSSIFKKNDSKLVLKALD